MVTVEQAIILLPAAINLASKISTIIASNTPMSVEEEMTALEAARMRPSEEIIAEADAVSKG